MANPKRVLISWSSGKDSAWLLHILRQSPEYEIVGLVTTFNEEFHRVAMHAVRLELVELQSQRAGLPLFPIWLPWPCSNEEYEHRMQQFMQEQLERDVTHFAFGDLYLEEIRDYRVRQLSGTGIEPIFPIWCGESGTPALAEQMLASGLKAVLTCVDSTQLSPDFLGREFDERLLEELPRGTDPCGERGEFHTFYYAGLHMSDSIDVTLGEKRVDGNFHFQDLMTSRA